MIKDELPVAVVWQIKDGKRGHENQSKGLIKALSKLRRIECYEIDVRKQRTNWFKYLFGCVNNFSDLPEPDLIIGAGSQTHSTVLAAGRATQKPTIVMMTPAKGMTALFDLCIVPEHDGRRASNMIVTSGVLNLIEISANKSTRSGLFLIGGPSKHHGWNERQTIEQISQIIEQSPEIHWTATTSRRSSGTTAAELTSIKAKNLTVVRGEDTGADWLPAQLNKANNVWVTEDSVSMVYEALSSGAKVGVLPVPRKSEKSRVINGLERLIEKGQVLPYNTNMCDLSSFDAPPPFNEAERVAEIVAEKFLSR